MSTRDELIYTVGQAMGAAWTDETGYALAPRTVADHLLIQGWRPPMRVIEAVEAAVIATEDHWAIYGWPFECSCGYVAPEKDQAATQASVEKHIVEIALAAALPAIEKEIRAQVAVEMKRRADEYFEFANRFGGYYMGLQSAFHEAARITEGTNHA